MAREMATAAGIMDAGLVLRNGKMLLLLLRDPNCVCVVRVLPREDLETTL